MTKLGHPLFNRCAIITNIPTPYRNPVYSLLPKSKFRVFFCARTEGNRKWKLPEPNFEHEFLNENVTSNGDGYNFIHNNPDIWMALKRFDPRIVITTGFNPTHLYAFLWAKLNGAHHICMTDGTLMSESKIGWLHRLVRNLVFRNSSAFISASLGGHNLFSSYKIASSRIFRSCLCVDNKSFILQSANSQVREYEVMFSGQMHERKLPTLFLDICKKLMRRRGKCRALVIGDGPLREYMLNKLNEFGVDYHYPGFIQPEDLPKWYAQAKVLLFTTRLDPWGIVANEAMASGTPVITTPEAGVAGDLVINGFTGYVLPPNASLWVNTICSLLDSSELWLALSVAGQVHVSQYNYRSATDGILAACEAVLHKSSN